ncbi:MAG: M64 family metallopeptidase, partial [Bdellovibrionia bacterium]
MLDLFGHRPTVGATTWTANETIAHELMGHTFAHLGDEYTHPYPGFPDIEEVNTTKTASRDSVKWKDWIQFSLTNIPNELISRNQGEARAVLDPVPGAHYSETGWYRPSVKCKLKELDHEFCRVCTHAIVRSIYNKVKPIDSVTPETAKGKSVDTSLTEPWSISVSLMHP